MTFQKKHLIHLSFFLLVLISSIRPVVDPDLGWQLGLGRYIQQNGVIPKQDIFSFSLSQHQYAYHNWLSSYILYFLFANFGLWGVSMFYALFTACVVFVFYTMILHRGVNLKITYLLLFFVLHIAWVIGARTQVITFFGLSLLYYFFDQRDVSFSTWFWIIPILFIAWTNMHGGFLLGIIFLGLLVTFKIISLWKSSLPQKAKRSNILLFIIVFIASSLATFFNPYGIHLHSQVIQISTNNAIHLNNDWQPLITNESYTFLLGSLLLLSVMTILLFSKPTRIKEKVLLVLFFLMTLMSKRYIILLLVVLIPALFSHFQNLVTKYGKVLGKNRFPYYIAGAYVFFTFFLLVIKMNIINWYACQYPKFYATEASQQIQYPYGAVLYMQEHGLPERLLNEYGWGGYLIWKLPQMKVFIDGRMDAFMVDDDSFANVYWRMIQLYPGWQELLKEYDIRSVLAPMNESLHWPLVEVLKLNSSWKIEYQDEVSILLKKSS